MSAPEPDPEFESLLAYVRDSRAFDYTGYKRPTLMRRFQKRMAEVGVDNFSDYRGFLEGDPDEFAQLFDAILINVTAFFRDPATWAFLAEEIVPRILEHRAHGEQIRVWSAGCATGAEAYTIAMLFAEAMGGEEDFRERIKIYATDVDEDALAYARHAAYTTKETAGVPEDLRERYFAVTNGHYNVRNGTRRAVVFGRNDLLRDPPISRVDLLVSRNTLMYFGREAQHQILSNFFFALQPRGYLLLGKAEALHSRTSLFEPFDLKRRVFMKDHGHYIERRATRPDAADEPRTAAGLVPPLRETAFEQALLAQIVVDSEGRVTAVNHAARTLFQLTGADVNRPLQDLQVSYKPVELRSLIERVEEEGRPLLTKDSVWEGGAGTPRHLDVHVSPLISQAGEGAGVVISFVDITTSRLLEQELERARRELQAAYDELQSTNEELETTNEELQSTNEELETTNEELQSTNEQLEAMNEELRERTDEAIQANAFFSSVLASVPQSVVVVDGSFRVAAWGQAAAEAWGLREEEVKNEQFLNLDIGIPIGELRDPIRQVLAGDTQEHVVLSGHDRRGHAVECTISFAPLFGPQETVQGAILLMAVERL